MSAETVTRAEFSSLEGQLGDIKALLGRMVDAMSKLAIIDERQAGFNDTSREILRRLSSIEERQHQADIEAAKNGDTGGRLERLENAVRDMHVEREKDKATQEGMVKMVRWMWVGVPFVMGFITWAAKHGFFLGA